MALDANNYINELTYGALIQTKNLAANSITGAKLSLSNQYVTFAVPAIVAGTNLFSTATAPVAGTITGFWTVAATVGTTVCTLFGTTAGTIAQITSSATVGTSVGTAVLNAAVVAGDTVNVKASTAVGSATCFVTFQTAA